MPFLRWPTLAFEHDHHEVWRKFAHNDLAGGTGVPGGNKPEQFLVGRSWKTRIR
jgi:hypothetical protein